ncbi:hypothetical protein [Amycolatopsis decaplanina]|uniref:Excreted virulence factor EspC, type VII ESX diderm n=1 Tax=Amycolatopsis decaplanina DSM 44594 TaxID=1284240 RepID=M2YZT0_9PSEU|nr:hypothetical protein [Amycolatopsis decaplanina]EME60487.1 hypothetical protein H074_15722 [Amycolatopsis decaplanina DSM 44594]
MTGPGAGGHAVKTQALTDYANKLGYYKEEAGKFGGLVDQADVTDKSWGLIGLAVKQTYTGKLADLRELLELMKTGVDAFSGKMTQAASIYNGFENDATITLGKYEAKIDGPN